MPDKVIDAVDDTCSFYQEYFRCGIEDLECVGGVADSPDDCPRRSGRVIVSMFVAPCNLCEGEGTIGCGRCQGSGEGMADGTKCRTCDGKGEVPCGCQEDRLRDEADAKDAAAEAKFDARRDGD